MHYYGTRKDAMRCAKAANILQQLVELKRVHNVLAVRGLVCTYRPNYGPKIVVIYAFI